MTNNKPVFISKERFLEYEADKISHCDIFFNGKCVDKIEIEKTNKREVTLSITLKKVFDYSGHSGIDIDQLIDHVKGSQCGFFFSDKLVKGAE